MQVVGLDRAAYCAQSAYPAIQCTYISCCPSLHLILGLGEAGIAIMEALDRITAVNEVEVMAYLRKYLQQYRDNNIWVRSIMD